MPYPNSAATIAACRSWRAAVVALALLMPAAAWAQRVQPRSAAELTESPDASAPQQVPASPTYKIIDPVERMPSFRGGGSAELVAYIQQQIRWPKASGRLREGRIFASFVIDTTGQVGDVRIIRGLHPLLDAEVVRVIQKLTGFIVFPQSNGKRYATEMAIPVLFKIR